MFPDPHLIALLLVLLLQKWVMFDDAHVAHVGDWPEVIRKCTAGRIQPLVLFYQRLPMMMKGK